MDNWSAMPFTPFIVVSHFALVTNQVRLLFWFRCQPTLLFLGHSESLSVLCITYYSPPCLCTQHLRPLSHLPISLSSFLSVLNLIFESCYKNFPVVLGRVSSLRVWAIGRVIKVTLRMPAPAWEYLDSSLGSALNSTFLLMHTLRGAGVGSGTWVSATKWETRRELLAPGFSLVQYWLLQAFGDWNSWWKILLSVYLSNK